MAYRKTRPLWEARLMQQATEEERISNEAYRQLGRKTSNLQKVAKTVGVTPEVIHVPENGEAEEICIGFSEHQISPPEPGLCRIAKQNSM